MTDEIVLYLFCGKMASGKSTLAASFAKEQHAVSLSEDILLGLLYPGEVVDVPTYVRYSGRIKEALRAHIVDLLRLGQSVVLDFPANTRNQREWLINIAHDSGARHELHYLACSDEQCKARLKKRALEQPEREETDTIEMFDAISEYFEPPEVTDGYNLVVHKVG